MKRQNYKNKSSVINSINEYLIEITKNNKIINKRTRNYKNYISAIRFGRNLKERKFPDSILVIKERNNGNWEEIYRN